MSQDILLSLYKHPPSELQCIVCTSYDYFGIISETARLQLKIILCKENILSLPVPSILIYCIIQIRVTDVGFVTIEFSFKLFLAKVKAFDALPRKIIQSPTTGHGTVEARTTNMSKSPPLFSCPFDETIISI